MTKIESLPLNIVLQLVKKELMDYCMTTHVLVKSVGFDPETCGAEEDGECTLMANAIVETEDERFQDCNGLHPWFLIWDENMCEFNTVQRWDWDQDEAE